jgi:hypothetical protein
MVYIITSFGLVFLADLFGHWGLLIVTLPTTIGFTWGVKYFERLEKNAELLQKPNVKKPSSLKGLNMNNNSVI